jgi:hypothetical protein
MFSDITSLTLLIIIETTPITYKLVPEKEKQ